MFTGVALHSSASENREVSVPQTDIPGLSSRVLNPFEFLGLYGTYHEACHRHDIPAKMVSLNKILCCGDTRQVQK
jgi:Zyg-11 family protein